MTANGGRMASEHKHHAAAGNSVAGNRNLASMIRLLAQSAVIAFALLFAPPLSAQQAGSKSAADGKAVLKLDKALSLDMVSSAPAGSLPFKLLGTSFRTDLEKRLRHTGDATKLELTVRPVLPSGSGAAKKVPPSAFQQVRSASADGGLIDIAKQQSALPLLQGPWHAPFATSDSLALARALQRSIEQTPEIRQSFLSKNNVLLAILGSGEFVLVTAFELKEIAALRGKKIGMPVPAMGWFDFTGALSMAVDEASFRAGLETGNLDGVLVPLTDIARLRLIEVAPYVTRVGFGSVPRYALTINKDLWDDLRTLERDALLSAGWQYQRALARANSASNAAVIASLKGLGAKISLLVPAERQAWGRALEALPKAWPKKMKKAENVAAMFMNVFLRQAGAAVKPDRDK